MSKLRTAGLFLVLLMIGYNLYTHINSMANNMNGEAVTFSQNTLPPVTNDDWGIIVGAPYAHLNDYAVNDYAPETAEDNGLTSSWKIKNRQDLIHQLFWLSMGGPTRVFYDMKNELAGMTKNEFDKLLADIEQSQEDETKKQEIIWQYKMMYNNTQNIQNMDYWVWDYVRFSMLCLEGSRLKYITPDEAKTWTRMLAPRLRKTYRNWADLWHTFLISRWFWAAQDKAWMQNQSNISDIIDNLLKEKDSPANMISWDAQLSSTDTLPFAKAVASLQLKDENGEIVSTDEVNKILQLYLNITDTN
ncbi:DUF1266 domain-containing protein [Xenorhabdus thailandensis]|uniref:DUF1266 domain-containing protein n=1 Tax=Xenorhabdus thailandensis TaxID=3136255 RepID=UPI0030F4737F